MTNFLVASARRGMVAPFQIVGIMKPPRGWTLVICDGFELYKLAVVAAACLPSLVLVSSG
jgi:hypothetical protein